MVHSVKYEADSSESPVDNDDQTLDYSENPANEAFIAENTGMLFEMKILQIIVFYS